MNKRILVVDDEAGFRELMCGFLAVRGYDVVYAADGHEAIEKLSSKKPDLILLDIIMPGIDGNELAARIKTCPDTRDIPIFFVTALAADMNALHSGASPNKIFPKPVDLVYLGTEIEKKFL